MSCQGEGGEMGADPRFVVLACRWAELGFGDWIELIAACNSTRVFSWSLSRSATLGSPTPSTLAPAPRDSTS